MLPALYVSKTRNNGHVVSTSSITFDSYLLFRTIVQNRQRDEKQNQGNYNELDYGKGQRKFSYPFI